MQKNIILAKLSTIDGYLGDFSQPTVIAQFIFKDPATVIFIEKRVRAAKALLFPGLSVEKLDLVRSKPLLNLVCEMYLLILKRANVPYFNFPQITDIKKVNYSETAYTIVLPSTGQPLTVIKELLNWSAEFVNAYQNILTDIEKYTTSVHRLIQKLEKNGLSTYTSYNFIRAAHKINAPWHKVNSKILQIGWGKYSQWFLSSIGPETSAVAVSLTSNKHDTTHLLRNAGLPVAPNALVNNLESAKKTAKYFTYPVVLKPLDFAGGKGVHCNIGDEQALTKAFCEVKKLTNIMLLEKHFVGRDYRIQVYNGVVYWAVLRTPAYITGNGQDSIEALIKTKNKQRLDTYNGIGILQLDEPTVAMLTAQGFDQCSIPDKQVHIKLSEVANVSKGGEITPVLDMAHPDNIAICENAANLCRIDIAGVDILLPDITRSWRETGAHICEINAQPQMSKHLPEHILSSLFSHDGRIPVHAMLLNSIDDISTQLTHLKKNISDKIAIIQSNENSMQIGARNIAAQFQTAIINKEISAVFIIYTVNDTQNLFSYPFDKLENIFIETKVKNELADKHLVSRAKHVIRFNKDEQILTGTTITLADAMDLIQNLFKEAQSNE